MSKRPAIFQLEPITTKRRRFQREKRIAQPIPRSLGRPGGGVMNKAAKPGFNPEMKSVDVTSVIELTNSGAGAGHTLLLNGLRLGTERYNRIGRRINVKSIHVNFWVSTTAANPAVVDDVFKFAVIWDEQPNGILPTIQDLWNATDQGGFNTATVLVHNNQNNSSRFRTLWHAFMPINAEAQGKDETIKSFYEIHIPLNHITQYNSLTNGNLGDIVTGAIYFVGHGGATAPPTVWSATVSSRCKYFD